MAFNPKDHMIDLKGKDYLQVMWRLVWFREEHPDGQIETELVEHKHGEYAVFKAVISEPKTEHVVATAYGSESVKDFRDYLEKAETKAIGRALAILGYGTQFAPELDEEERIVDSPVQTNKGGYSVENPTSRDVAAIAKDVANHHAINDRDKAIKYFYSQNKQWQETLLANAKLAKIEDIKSNQVEWMIKEFKL